MQVAYVYQEMTSRTVTLNNQREYAVNDIGDVLSSNATDETFSLLDIEDVLDPPDTGTLVDQLLHIITCFVIRLCGWFRYD